LQARPPSPYNTLDGFGAAVGLHLALTPSEQYISTLISFLDGLVTRQNIEINVRAPKTSAGRLVLTPESRFAVHTTYALGYNVHSTTR